MIGHALPVACADVETEEIKNRKGSIETIEGTVELTPSSKHLMDSGKYIDDVENGATSDQLNIWTLDHIGLYCVYGAGGLLYGTCGTLSAFCVYVYHGQPNVCANTVNLYFFAWNFKIIYAIVEESFRPFGLRRKPWMIAGFSGVLLILAVLIASGPSISASNWIAACMMLQISYIIADVSADGEFS
jgi:hypothetical protein